VRRFAFGLSLLVVGCGSSSPDDGGGTGGATANGGSANLGGAGSSAGGSAGAGTGGSAGSSAGGNGGSHATGGSAGSAGDGGSESGGGGSGGAISSEGDGDFTISPPYADAPELTVNDVPHGTLHDFVMNSSDSVIYPKDFATHGDFSRSVSVYVPAQYETGTDAPFMVVQDGISLYRDAMVVTLDNLIDQARVPVMIVIFVEPGPNEGTPVGERSFEYDSVSEDYVNFVETELLPKVSNDYDVTFTSDPDGRATMGGSSGGAAAFTAAWFRPDLYHRVLTFSGSFCDLQPNEEYPLGAWSYHDSLIENTESKPLRVALEAGQNDFNWNTDQDMFRNWLIANEAMAADLAAKGYHYRYVYAEGAGHVDPAVTHQILPETLEWLWEGYPIP
jgi:enterochelin esterase-like enzyme